MQTNLYEKLEGNYRFGVNQHESKMVEGKCSISSLSS